MLQTQLILAYVCLMLDNAERGYCGTGSKETSSTQGLSKALMTLLSFCAKHIIVFAVAAEPSLCPSQSMWKLSHRSFIHETILGNVPSYEAVLIITLGHHKV